LASPIAEQLCDEPFSLDKPLFLEQEDKVVERVLTALHVALESPPSN
jgi:hypothetical protein